MLIDILLFMFGAVLLIIGADMFIKNAAKFAESLGVSQFIIGLTLGAIATSLPEFVVSIMAALSDKAAITIGNILGSNIANIALALGIGAMIKPVIIDRKVLHYDYWLMLLVSLLFYILLRDGQLLFFEGLVLFVLFIVYIVLTANKGRKERDTASLSKTPGELLRSSILILCSIVLLVLGAHWLVMSAANLAKSFGVSEAIIAISIVALGTSLPEIVVVVMGTIRARADISIGTIVGSNIINILLIAGFASIIVPIKINIMDFMYNAPIMILFLLLLFPFIIKRSIGRVGGILLCISYFAYMIYIY